MGFNQKIQALAQNDFMRSASTLVGGTAAAQALTILALPFLTRLYSPADFSLLAVYIAILTMAQVVVCLRIEIAIPLPEDDQEAANLFTLAVSFALSLSILSGLLILFFGDHFFELIGQPLLEPYAWLLPFGIAFAGLYASMQYWSTRKSRFSAVARTRMAQSGAGLGTQFGLAWLGTGAIGLLAGHTVMAGAGVFNLARHAWKSDLTAFKAVSLAGMGRAFREYRRFPLYSTWEALANNAALQLPILMIAAYAIGPEAGYLLLATRAIGTPVTMIGTAVGQVYLSKAPKKLRDGSLPEFNARVLSGLIRLGIAPLVVFGLIAPVVFSTVFGDEWQRAGELVLWMTPWFILKFLSSPISMVMHVKMKQRTMLVLMLVGLFLRLGITLGAYWFDPKIIAEGYAVSGALFYMIALATYVKTAGLTKTLVRSLALRFLGSLGIGIGIGFAANAIFKTIGYA